MTALLPSLPPGAMVRFHGARTTGLLGRGGPAPSWRARSLEAGLLLRLCAGTRTRTCGGGPCCLLSSLRASATARGLRMRGNARTGRWEPRWAVAHVALRQRRGESNARGHGRARRQQQQRGGTSGISREIRARSGGQSARGARASGRWNALHTGNARRCAARTRTPPLPPPRALALAR